MWTLKNIIFSYSFGAIVGGTYWVLGTAYDILRAGLAQRRKAKAC